MQNSELKYTLIFVKKNLRGHIADVLKQWQLVTAVVKVTCTDGQSQHDTVIFSLYKRNALQICLMK